MDLNPRIPFYSWLALLSFLIWRSRPVHAALFKVSLLPYFRAAVKISEWGCQRVLKRMQDSSSLYFPLRSLLDGGVLKPVQISDIHSCTACPSLQLPSADIQQSHLLIYRMISLRLVLSKRKENEILHKRNGTTKFLFWKHISSSCSLLL